MINLNFTEKELETLKEYFQSELYKAEQTIDNIRGILGKIGKKQGKTQQAAKRGRKKVSVAPALQAKAIVEKKRPGRKPKALKEAEISAASKIQKKRGRPPKAKVEAAGVPAAKVKIIKSKPVKKATPKAKPARVKVEKPKTVAKVKKTVPVIEGVKRKPGRPKTKPVVVAEKKTKVESAGKKAVVVKAKPVKTEAKLSKKKEIKTPKIPWGDWILAILRDSENNLTQEQIFTAISNRLQITGEEFTAAEKKLKDQMNKLLKAKKILPSEEGENPVYSLKISGKGL